MSDAEPILCPLCGLEPPEPDDHAQRHGFDTLAAAEASLQPLTPDERARQARKLEDDLRGRGYHLDTDDTGLRIAKTDGPRAGYL